MKAINEHCQHFLFYGQVKEDIGPLSKFELSRNVLQCFTMFHKKKMMLVLSAGLRLAEKSFTMFYNVLHVKVDIDPFSRFELSRKVFTFCRMKLTGATRSSSEIGICVFRTLS